MPQRIDKTQQDRDDSWFLERGNKRNLACIFIYIHTHELHGISCPSLGQADFRSSDNTTLILLPHALYRLLGKLRQASVR